MKIYIASSWKNQHAVEMLTALLRDRGHEVLSFVENNHGEQVGHLATAADKPIDFDEWCESERGQQSFDYDTLGAMRSDLVIYVAPSGKDAAAECGMAYAQNVPIIGLHAKGEDFGLMRKMMIAWLHDYKDVLNLVDSFAIQAGNSSEPYDNRSNWNDSAATPAAGRANLEVEK